ncbi:hypothetical protein GIB67_035534 [Kingdonia uniflora]|uniref:VASt domain-containing protein n=1 Tax=Kingdonia uniflora TaxID=39325 RepID=A0A7J7MC39_9MAGN|nr:hypothetical protein GIB67_035534 [Kingdonia uniflora]
MRKKTLKKTVVVTESNRELKELNKMMSKQLEVILTFNKMKLRTLANFDGDGRFADAIEDELEIGEKKIVEKTRLKLGVVTEDSKKFDGDDLEMKHLEETTEREVHRAIDLVAGKDGDMPESSRSKDNEEVVTLMRGVHMINDSNRQEAQPKNTNPNPKALSRIRRTIGERLNSSPLTMEWSLVTRVANSFEREEILMKEIVETRELYERGLHRSNELEEIQSKSSVAEFRQKLGSRSNDLGGRSNESKTNLGLWHIAESNLVVTQHRFQAIDLDKLPIFDESESPEEVKAESALRAHSSSIRASRRRTKVPDDNVPKTVKLQAFIKEEVLVGIYNGVFLCTAEQFFNILLGDDSEFINEYRSARKDTNLNLGQWDAADEYGGQVRDITFRTLCHSPMCPPDSAMTEWQHALLSPDKKTLIFETVQQAHDVPFGSYFEILHIFSHFELDINSVHIDDNNEDCCFWLPYLQGKFSAHNAYNWIRDCEPDVWWHKWVWGSSVLRKVSNFCWRMMNWTVPTDCTLQSRRITMVSICYLCKNGAESFEHLFWDCVYGSDIRDWCFSLFQIDITVDRSVSSFKPMLALCSNLSSFLKDLWGALILNSLYQIWLFRNNVLFNDMHPDLRALKRKIISVFREGAQISKATMYNNVHELSILHTIGVQSCVAFNSDSLPWKLQLPRNKLKRLFTRIRIRITTVGREVNFGADAASKRGTTFSPGEKVWYDGRPFLLERIEGPPYVHCKWSLETNSESSCTIDIKVGKILVPYSLVDFLSSLGVHFKKWCVMQSKIKAGAVSEYKKEVDIMLEMAREYIKSKTSGGVPDELSSVTLLVSQNSSLY